MEAPKYIKEKLKYLIGEINSNIIVVGDFNTPLSAMDRSSTQRLNKEIVDVNNTKEQMDLTDI